MRKITSTCYVKAIVANEFAVNDINKVATSHENIVDLELIIATVKFGLIVCLHY